MALAWLQAQTSVLATEAASRGLMHLKISFLGRLELVINVSQESVLCQVQ